MLFLKVTTHYYDDDTHRCATRSSYHQFRTLIDLNSYLLTLESRHPTNTKLRKEFTFEFTQTSPLPNGEWDFVDFMHSTLYDNTRDY